MNRLTLCLFRYRTIPAAIFSAFMLACWTGSSAFAQHAGGHVGGAHVSAPPVAHPVAPPHVIPRPVTPVRPPLPAPGGRGSVTRPIVIPHYSPPNFAIGYPFPPRHIHPHFPYHPIAPVPIVPRSGFGIYGLPFFGLGYGWGVRPGYWPGCDQYWIWGYGCNGLPLYGYGYGPDLNVLPLEPSFVPPPIEIQTWPVYYGVENPEHVDLYLTDGTIYSVTDYWLVNGELHFKVIEESGTKIVEHTIDFNQLDLQKTIDVNTARGFRFVLRNEPIEQYIQDHPSLEEPGETPLEAPPIGTIEPVPPGPIQPAPPSSPQAQ